MRDPLWGATWRISAGALGLTAVASAVLLSLGHPQDALGLLCGSFISGLNFLATGRFLSRARLAASSQASEAGPDSEVVGAMERTDAEAERRRQVALSNQAAFRFVIRYVFIGAVLALLILGFGLPPATTVLGVAAVPLTIYVWQMGRLLTGRWRRSVT
jgi:hypothetical protein